MKNLKKRGFTLIEMLIVVVIIGILAAALIPRLGSAKDKANDASRSTAISQIATAMGTYALDYGWAGVPLSGASDGTFATYLSQGGLKNPPLDPRKTSSTIFGVTTTGFAIVQVQKAAGVTGFLVVAAVETPGMANWVDSTANPTGGTDMTTFQYCTKVVESGAVNVTNRADCGGTSTGYRKILAY